MVLHTIHHNVQLAMCGSLLTFSHLKLIIIQYSTSDADMDVFPYGVINLETLKP